MVDKKLLENIFMKQVFVVRTDIKMGKGKIAAQVAHAAIECYKRSSKRLINLWEKEGCKKVVLKCNSLSELLSLYRKCLIKKIPCVLIRDAGLTQIAPGTITCLGAGPYYDDILDTIFGHLKLL